VNGQDASGKCPPFTPTYPSGCPYILSVGATQNFSPEVAAAAGTGNAGFYGGGGFSNYFPTPDYQQGAVQSYLSSLGSSQSGNYNATGRGYPDVSAQGANQLIYNGGKQMTVGGTSASAPVVASGLTLLNDKLQKAGKRPVGWINPMLYSNPGVWNDITSGGSYGCGSNGGFPTAAGWDPSTGVGTPNFTNWRNVYGV